MTAVAEPSEDALKLMVQQHGVRGTARMLGYDDRQTETFRKRVQRAGWMQLPEMRVNSEAIRSENIVRSLDTNLVPKVSPMMAEAEEMRANAIGGRASALRLGCRSLRRLERCDDDELITPEITDSTLKWTKQHATAAGYGVNTQVGSASKAFGRTSELIEITAESSIVEPVDEPDESGNGVTAPSE